jgi:hypothetical protein
MSKQPKINTFVMTVKFREGLRDAYREALTAAGVPANNVKPHIIGSATVTVTDAQLENLRGFYGDQMTELSGHGNSGAIEILLPAGEAYLLQNRPVLSDEERAAKESGGGRGGVSTEEREKREAARKRMEALLQDRYGVDLSLNRPSAQADEQEQQEAAESDETDADEQAETPRGKGRGKNRIG